MLLMSAGLAAGACSNDDDDGGAADGDSDGDGDGDTDSDSDSDSDGDSDSEGDSESQSDTDATPPMTDCEGGKLDSETGLCWQHPAAQTDASWQACTNYCDALSAGGSDNWRVPSIDELRSLIRGCPETEPDGECEPGNGATPCDGCPELEGPTGGCYWDSALTGDCQNSFGFGEAWWSSTESTSMTDFAYAVYFDEAQIVQASEDGVNGNVRCVRDI